MTTRKDRIQKRIDELTIRARLTQRGAIPIVDTTQWSDADRIAYQFGSVDERAELVERLHGPLPEQLEPGEIVAIVVTAPLGPPIEDD